MNIIRELYGRTIITWPYTIKGLCQVDKKKKINNNRDDEAMKIIKWLSNYWLDFKNNVTIVERSKMKYHNIW